MNALSPVRAGRAEALLLRLDGFEGPLDLLLELARAGKVDLSTISILALVEQYLAVIEGARRIRLELAADWLVMAAWLAWLKSRLLLPEDEVAAEQASEAVVDLAERLEEVARVRALARWLDDRPVLGRDVFARALPEDHTVIDRSGLRLDLPGLVAAYLSAGRRAAATRRYVPPRHAFWTIDSAIAHLRRLLGSGTGWVQLDLFLPAPKIEDPALAGNASRASTLLASLELARSGLCELRQDAPFTPVLLRRKTL